jgi:hypothetical protein
MKVNKSCLRRNASGIIFLWVRIYSDCLGYIFRVYEPPEDGR